MKLATLRSQEADGRLLVVSRDLSCAVLATSIVATLQQALENWHAVEPPLRQLYQQLNDGVCADAIAFAPQDCAAPLPRAYQWLDASSFTHHGELMQQAFHLPPLEGAETTPLMYQGASDDFIGGREPIRLPSEAHGIDFEGEFFVLSDAVPMGCSALQARQHIKLIGLLNDVSLRALAPREMRNGFGFVQAKPTTSFAAVVVTPDELGESWRDERVHLDLQVYWNGELFGHPNGAEMNFSFARLIEHAALTRRLCAGTVLGSGTVSNRDRAAGSACISERRALEMIESGAAHTPFMAFGDHILMQVLGTDGQSLFASIDQTVVQFAAVASRSNQQ
ncbi:fumarylacetoacetate hydrolase family protein [Pseudomonas sp. MWU16-30317]|uniref:fumarylacetoacetate hydrolase family protein n=1 Tax=Pseudomonas sp. MWU16-30317 TaxID=2878095 RepID=UPI001CFBF1C1|nr:fumarylacetoacetate hydrolase family protein [Pseudomonas sp. MWU16-30317]